MTLPRIYISRPQAETFLAEFAQALNQPSSQPLLLHLYGMGGVGKTTLLQRLKYTHKQHVDFAEVSFGLTAGIETPLKLMAKLYEQLPKPPSLLKTDVKDVLEVFKSDPFTSLYKKYQETVDQLENQPVEGKTAVDSEQVKLVKQILNLGASTVGQMAMPGIAAATLGKAAEASVDAAALILTEKDRLLQLLQQHRATKQKKELQDLMLEPLPKFTQAFAQGLSQKAQKRPVVLVLDTYEKASTDIDFWLCQHLLGNTELKSHSVRIVVAGRYNLRQTEYWRKLQQDRDLLYVQPIERFDKQQTAEYLQTVGITEPNKVEDVYQATKGLPYYLNWIRREKAAGREIDFSQGNQEIVQFLLQGLNHTQKLVSKLAACCRWFDRGLIQYLMNSQTIDFDTAADDSLNCFEWLKQRDFVQPVQHRHRLDDVARDVFRKSLWEEDEKQFHQIHELLANYYEEQATREVPSDSPPPARYENSDWRKSIAEFLYHALFSRASDCQHQFISHLFASRYFRQDEVVAIPFGAITAEADLTDHPLLTHATRQFLTKIQPAIEYGWEVFENEPIDWKFLETCGFSKPQIEATLQTCFSHTSSLEGLAKFAALLYQSRRCPEQKRLSWLEQAKVQAEQIATPAEPEFSSGLFLWDMGLALGNLGRIEEAIASYDKALEVKPDKHEAWNNRGLALGNLGRIEEAIASYDKALEVKPDKHEAWDNRGYALSKLGRYQEALSSHDKALQLQPDYVNAFYNKACCYALQGNVDLAIENLQQAIKLNPEKYREMAKTDSDFDSLREDARFQKLIQGYKN